MAASITITTAHGPPATPETEHSAVNDRTFEDCVWGDYFANYTPPPSQRSEEWMRERADELKGEVRWKINNGKTTMGMDETMKLVDTLERLGIDRHFHKEIDLALSQIHMEEKPAGISSSSELYIVALGFRLFRQHGYWVSSDVFRKFRDRTCKLDKGLSNDVRGLLSLYNAAHMAVPGEESLDEAIDFTQRCLEAAKDSLMTPLLAQVSRALNVVPLPRYMPRLETMYYIPEYEQENDHDAIILELARLDYALHQCLYLRELKDLTLWWKELYDSVNLPNTRSRVVEMYFFAFGTLQTEYSRARVIQAKIVGLVGLLDDLYDVNASFEEAKKFNEAIQRWDKSEVSKLLEYMRMMYTRILRAFAEFENDLEPEEKYRMPFGMKAYQLQSEYYFQEVKWLHENYVPSFREHLNLSARSGGLQLLIVASYMGPHNIVTKETLEWAISFPEFIGACGDVGRVLNDMASFKKRKNNKDVFPNALQCYIMEHDSTEEEALAAGAAMLELGWRRLNRARMEVHPIMVPVPQMEVVINISRTCEVFYYGGTDGFTFGSDLQGVVTSLFIKPLGVGSV